MPQNSHAAIIWKKQMTQELPSIKDELERKTFERLERLIYEREHDLITNAEYKASIETMFAICSGLVDNGFFKMITLAAEETVNDYSFDRARIFRKGSKLKIFCTYKNRAKNEFTIEIMSCDITKESIFGGECEVDHFTNEKNDNALNLAIKHIKNKLQYVEI